VTSRAPTPITSRRRLKLLAALRRVNRQLGAWDALELMPATLRPRVEVPALDREQLKGLQVEVVGALDDSGLAPGGPGTPRSPE
jgi:hypothetical protein